MTKFWSLEERAARRTGAVERLRFLRSAERRRLWRGRVTLQAGRVLLALAGLFCSHQMARSKAVAPVIARRAVVPVMAARKAIEPIWVVEANAARVLYSNGLTVHREHETESVPRRYRVYSGETLSESPELLTVPAGIVFHTTESQILPLRAERNGALLRSREDVLEHARKGRLYNFVIDRFGQVSRIVPETQTALHAGHSVWAAGGAVWINLNESFLGISFEAESTEAFTPSAAQLHSGRLLTEMLRAQYGIAEANCVTHAQVSINPDNMRAGYHTDWGSNFPFAAMGLGQGYGLPVASVAVFGFRHDETFLRAMGGEPWPGLVAADEELDRQAAQLGLTPYEVRTRLQQRYKTLRRHKNG